MKELTQNKLKELASYNPETGIFTRLTSSGGNKVGTTIGCLDSLGYVKCSILGKQTHTHRLAFLYMTGSIPKEVDHIDGDRSNNRWNNLREVTRGQNQYNSKLHRDSTSNVKGLSYHKENGVWKACVIFEGTQYTKSLAASEDCEITKAVLTGWLMGVRELLHKEFTNHGA